MRERKKSPQWETTQDSSLYLIHFTPSYKKQTQHSSVVQERLKSAGISWCSMLQLRFRTAVQEPVFWARESCNPTRYWNFFSQPSWNSAEACVLNLIQSLAANRVTFWLCSHFVPSNGGVTFTKLTVMQCGMRLFYGDRPETWNFSSSLTQHMHSMFFLGTSPPAKIRSSHHLYALLCWRTFDRVDLFIKSFWIN